MSIGPGDPAPDFALPGTGDRTYRLADHRGEPVVLVFYPGDDTPVCTRQLTSYNRDIERFAEVGATILAISPQDVASHDRFACRLELGFPLLADTDRAVGDAYGVVGPLGFYRRSVFVVDGAGVVRYAHRALAGLSYRSADEIVAAVADASAR